jgi:aspartyl-tRNA(Asn)/glutamyl-tRNA(Gln) amidotransferase subunit C
VSVDKNTVRKVARLARIAVPEDRQGPMAVELNGILSWIEQLNEVDVEGVDAMTTPVAMTLPMREDVVSDGGIRDAVLANAPRTEDGFFVVPKVVE